jgi:hypothetical protein
LQSFTPLTKRRAPQREYMLGGKPRGEFVRWCARHAYVTRDMIAATYKMSHAQAGVMVQTARRFGLLEHYGDAPGVKVFYRLTAAHRGAAL